MRAAPLLLALALLAGACSSGGAGGPDRAEYLQANEDLVLSLPQYPGAREVARETSPYSRGDAAYAEPAGYTTVVVYELPRRVAQRDVIDFYVGALEGWREEVEYAPGVDVLTGEERPGAWSATFRREGAAVSVNTDNLVAGRRYEIAVDHAGG